MPRRAPQGKGSILSLYSNPKLLIKTVMETLLTKVCPSLKIKESFDVLNNSVLNFFSYNISGSRESYSTTFSLAITWMIVGDPACIQDRRDRTQNWIFPKKMEIIIIIGFKIYRTCLIYLTSSRKENILNLCNLKTFSPC